MQSEADDWHRRNVDKLDTTYDPVLISIIESKIIYGAEVDAVFEVGCGNGYRLAWLRDSLMCRCWGCDLSKEAIAHGLRTYGDKNLQIGWREAKNLKGIPTQGFDLVIYGFCLYQCDPEDLFQIVREGDRILKDGGHLIIYDFLPDHPHSRNYKYDRALRTYKHDYAKLWLAHPAYSVAYQKIFPHEADEEINHDTRVAVTILKKNVEGGFPLEP